MREWETRHTRFVHYQECTAIMDSYGSHVGYLFGLCSLV